MSPLAAAYQMVSRAVASTTPPLPGTAEATPLQVVCAWPVSSQYGAGSRFLYYVIVSACVLLRKNEQLREASLAAALVVPAISALHGLVLSFYHVNGKVDFDIFGAFQLCAIAMLAAPLTVRISQTYFFAQGRNIIFLWTILMVAGLISLCIEFYRVTATDCPGASSARNFSYNDGEELCKMNCNEDSPPFSAMRGGSARNVYVVPVPRDLTFNAAMLLAAGICIPAILSLLFTADRILEVNWKKRRGIQLPQPGDQVEGGNITVGELNNINAMVTKFLSVIEIPVFGGAVLAIVIIGEINFFSKPLMYETEPMASIGQWSPIAGTCLAAVGSLLVYMTNEKKPQRAVKEAPGASSDQSQCGDSYRQHLSPTRDTNRGRSLERQSPNQSIRSSSNDLQTIPTIEIAPDDPTTRQQSPPGRPESVSNAGRGVVRKWFEKASIWVSDAAHEGLDTSDFRDKNVRAKMYPTTPGEELRNGGLDRTSTQYESIRQKAASIRSMTIPEAGPSSHTQQNSRRDSSPYRPSTRRVTLEVPPQVHLSPRLGQQEWS